MSSDYDYNYELDAILSEFTGEFTVQEEKPVPASPPPEKPLKPEKPAQETAQSQADSAEETTVFTPVRQERTPDGDPITHFADKYKKAEAEKKSARPIRRAARPAPDGTRVMSLKNAGEEKAPSSLREVDPALLEAQEKKRAASAAAKAEREKAKEAAKAEREKAKAEREEKKAEKKALKEEKKRKKEEKPPRETFADVTPPLLVRFVGLVLTMVLLLFLLCTVTPASGSAAAGKVVTRSADIAQSVNRFATEKTREAAIAESALQAEIAEQLAASVKTVYKIPEDAVVAPEPLATGFGKMSTANAAEIMTVIQQARDSGLLREDETVVFDPNVEFNTASYYQDIQYYLDDTLLVICWKEIINGNTCTFCEVKMQDGSQLRRKLAGDMFGSDVLEYTTSMHKATNAVVSMNADYYRFRDMGIVVYNRQLYRFNESDYLYRYQQMLKKYNCIDTMFVTGSGDFLFFHMYEETTPGAMQQFIDDNDIIFSIAFGPVLVENGELNTSYFDEEWYPIGEINTGYSRAGIGQVDELHYLYMSLNHSNEKAARWHTKEFAEHFYEKGVINAYSLDGGQTSEIVFQGNEAYNHVDHVNGTSSRQVSDMIYFASAIHGEEVTQ